MAGQQCLLPPACRLGGHTQPLALSQPHLQAVIQKGKLNVKVLEMFEQTEHESLLASTAGLDKRSLPLLSCDQNGPLGYTKPTWQ